MNTLPHFAGAILRHGSHFFLLQRTGSAKHWPLYWGFPGGKIEPDETPAEAAEREILEEIGVTVHIDDTTPLINITAHYHNGIRINTLFLIDSWEGIPENLEPKIHENIGWFTLDELPIPMIDHVRTGLFAILNNEKTCEYFGI